MSEHGFPPVDEWNPPTDAWGDEGEPVVEDDPDRLHDEVMNGDREPPPWWPRRGE